MTSSRCSLFCLTLFLSLNAVSGDRSENLDAFHQAYLNARSHELAEKIYQSCLRDVEACGVTRKSFASKELKGWREKEIETALLIIRNEYGLDAQHDGHGIHVEWEAICPISAPEKRLQLAAAMETYKQRKAQQEAQQRERKKEYESWVKNTVEDIFQYCLSNISSNQTRWEVDIRTRYGSHDFTDVIESLRKRGLQVNEVRVDGTWVDSGTPMESGYWSEERHYLEITYVPEGD